jgi:hypothetical protein
VTFKVNEKAEINPFLSIMHISDIHRTNGAIITNSELKSSLLSDSIKFSSEIPQIKKPDLIIVSGDIIQGLTVGVGNYPSDIENQYFEAKNFLLELVNIFLEGDRSKLIMVPGNHDVDWNLAYSSMKKTQLKSHEVLKALLSNESRYRWNWGKLQSYKISDMALYHRRLDSFSNFFQGFYDGYDVEYKISPEFQYSLFKINDDIIVAAFNSCHFNDCLNYSGDISREAISNCHMAIEENYSKAKLRIAVWHHDFHGPPLRTDYMDRGIIELLLDKGFRLGIHGHQHKSESRPFYQFLQDEETMAIVSAGSLTAGEKELPSGFNRQYNMLEIDTSLTKVRVHIREMISNGIFSKGRHTFMGGKSFADLSWTKYGPSELLNYIKDGGQEIKILDRIEKLIHENQYKEALELIDYSGLNNENYLKRLKADCLEKLSCWDELIQHVGVPENANDISVLFKSYLKINNFKEPDELLERESTLDFLGQSALDDFKKRLAMEKKIKGIIDE